MHLGSSTFSDTQIVNITVSGLVNIYDDNTWEWVIDNSFKYDYSVTQVNPGLTGYHFTYDFNEDSILEDLDELIEHSGIMKYGIEGEYRYTISAKLVYDIGGLREDYSNVYYPEDDPDIYTGDAYADLILEDSGILNYSSQKIYN